MNQTVRIIGGRFRGKKLPFPSINELRPTPDRVRETLFNWLMHDVRETRCLDAFAGSGALGFEAFSRGASNVLLLEQNASVYTNLLNVASSFNSPKLQVKHIDACTFLQQTTDHFDIIFLDPPFAKDYLPLCIKRLADSEILIPGGLLYIESAQEIVLDQTIWQEIKLKRAGQVVYGLYKKLPRTAHIAP
jgi:16S rRNA (guanine966-N2)-methyltransferase